MVEITTFGGVNKSGRHIVALKDHVSKEGFIYTHRLETIYNYRMINAFAGRYNQITLDELCASDDVERISEDPAMRLCTIQHDAPWGLARLGGGPVRLQAMEDLGEAIFQYEYEGPAAAAGAGVDIYIFDSGVLTTHEEFVGPDGGSRAQWGATFHPDLVDDVDDVGHGTHCAGIVAGNRYGVAKGANVIAVKIFHDGNGYPADAIAGLDFVHDRISAPGMRRRPSVVSMSFIGDGVMLDLVWAIMRLTNAGVHVIAASGSGDGINGELLDREAYNFFPANADTAMTVGYADINDSMVVDCNYGPILKLLAPGVNIRSAWIGANDAFNNIGGTSMAAAYVSGLAAYRISRHGDVTPAAMTENLMIAGVPVILNSPPGDTNILAHH